MSEGELAVVAAMPDRPGAQQQEYRAVEQADRGVRQGNGEADGPGRGEAHEQGTVDDIAYGDGQYHPRAEAAFRH